MALILRIINRGSPIAGFETERRFDEAGGRIGRAPSNDWVLPDPERYLSGCHASVSFDQGLWYVIDNSTNGTFINSQQVPIGRGNRVVLNDGDRMLLGDYQIEIRLADALMTSPTGGFIPTAGPNTGTGLTDPSRPGSSLAGLGGDPGDHETLDPLEAFGPGTPTPQPLPERGATPDHVPASAQHFAPPGASRENPPAGGGSGSGIPDDWDQTSFDKAQQAPAAAPVSPSAPSAPAASPGVIPTSWDAPAVPPGAGAAGIPDDWDKTSYGSGAAVPAQPPPVQPPAAAPPGGFGAPLPPAVQPPAAQPAGMQPGAPAQPVAPPSPGALPPAPTPAQPPPASQQPPQYQQSPPVAGPGNQAMPAGPPPSPASSQRMPDLGGGGSVDAIAALLAGANLDPSHAPADAGNQLLFTSGQMLREVVAGLMEVLMARSNLKSEFRIAQTVIRPQENNPLKFSPSVDDALEMLLLRRGTGYLDPTESMREGVRDIKAHQIAMMSGMRAAFESLLRQLDPEEMARRWDKGSRRGSLLGMGNRSRYWDMYCAQHEEQMRDLGESFRTLFGEEFARAYEEQMQRLTAGGK